MQRGWTNDHCDTVGQRGKDWEYSEHDFWVTLGWAKTRCLGFILFFGVYQCMQSSLWYTIFFIDSCIPDILVHHYLSQGEWSEILVQLKECFECSYCPTFAWFCALPLADSYYSLTNLHDRDWIPIKIDLRWRNNSRFITPNCFNNEFRKPKALPAMDTKIYPYIYKHWPKLFLRVKGALKR